MIRTLLLGAVVAVTAASAEAKDAAAVYGAGTLSCGQWQQSRAGSTNRDKGNSFQLQAWIDGFLSGYNLADDSPDFLKGMPDGGTSFHFWIDNYCKNKPLDTLVIAATALKDELQARARR
jgi:hypothetical protein